MNGEWIGCRLGEAACLLPVVRVQEIAASPPITALPAAPAHVAGVASVRGRVVPLLDLRGCFGGSADSGGTASTRVVVVAVDRRTAPQRIGLLVDEVGDVLAATGCERLDPEPRTDAAAGCVAARIAVGPGGEGVGEPDGGAVEAPVATERLLLDVDEAAARLLDGGFGA